MELNYKEFCSEIYEKTYQTERIRIQNELLAVSKKGNISESKLKDMETQAQKEAIKQAMMEAMRKFPTVEAALVWKAVYEIHVHRKSGIDNAETIAKVISADQSWKKSSGHAFEEMIKFLGTVALKNSDIEIILQRDLSTLIKAGEINNEPRDISWLKEQINASIFDLYAIVNVKEKKYCFGCIQGKTSIRDRVTRDREPSMQAMQSFFWSAVIVLDGDFLKNGKFVSMVNGGTAEHETNGWHGMYVFSEKYTQDRIYATDLNFKNFKEHAEKAAEYWLTQRQWFNNNWRADEGAEK